MSYTMCPACGQHALKVANRCPRCGQPFEEQFFSRAQPSRSRHRLPRVLVLAAVLALMLGTAEWINRRKAAGAGKAGSRDSVSSAPTPVPAAPPAAIPAAETTRQAEPAALPGRPAAPKPAPVPVREPEQPRRVTAAAGGTGSHVANDWVNVRARPSSTAPIVGVLQPGESVTVDSTIQGWYRVRAGRVPAGYVGRGLLQPRAP
jgi:hypothetical protein